jgi:hypothetical protein
MKIADLILRVQNLYPHSLKIEEMIDFCNEVGAILRSKYIEEFKTVELKNGEMLPDGVGKDDIVRVSVNGEIIPRNDYGEYMSYPESRRFLMDIPDFEGVAEVTYRVPYEPIRYFKDIVSVESTDGGFRISNPWDIRIGDIYLIDGELFTVNAVNTEDGKTTVSGDRTIAEGSFEFEKVIDEVTVVSEPFDRIYQEYLLSKVARFSRDYEGENRALENYRVWIEDLEKHLVRNGKRPAEQRFFNYW